MLFIVQTVTPKIVLKSLFKLKKGFSFFRFVDSTTTVMVNYSLDFLSFNETGVSWGVYSIDNYHVMYNKLYLSTYCTLRDRSVCYHFQTFYIAVINNE